MLATSFRKNLQESLFCKCFYIIINAQKTCTDPSTDNPPYNRNVLENIKNKGKTWDHLSVVRENVSFADTSRGNSYMVNCNV